MRFTYLEEVCPHFNEPILIGFDLYRVVGYGEDDHDCYIICQGVKGKIIWSTMVGGYFFLGCLKGQGYVKAHNGEDWDDLFRMSQMLEYAGSPKAEKFLIQFYDEKADKYITVDR